MEDDESCSDESDNTEDDGSLCHDERSHSSESMEETSESSSVSSDDSDDRWVDSDEATVSSEDDIEDSGEEVDRILDEEQQDLESRPVNMAPPEGNGTVVIVNPEGRDQSRKVGGAKFECYRAHNGTAAFVCKTRMKGKRRVKLEDDLVRFVIDLQERFEEFYPHGVELRTLHVRNGVKFRGHVSHMGEIWRDWVMVRWENNEESKPCRI